MAATGTPTPNIGLRRPQGTDPASVDDINYNSGRLDTVLGAVGNTSVKAQIDALNGKIASLIKSVDYSGNTNANGLLTIPTNTLNPVNALAFAVMDNAGAYGSIKKSSGTYYLKLWDTTNGTFEVIANSPVSGKIYYFSV